MIENWIGLSKYDAESESEISFSKKPKKILKNPKNQKHDICSVLRPQF